MSSSRNNRTVAMYFEDKSKPAKPLLSDGWPKVLGEICHVLVEGVKQVRVAFTKYRLRTGFKMIVTHNERSRFTAKCEDEKCGWKFHAASIDERNEMFQVRSYNPEHICGTGARNLNQTYSTSFSYSLIEEEVRKNPHKKPKQIAADFQTNYGINMEYYQAYNAREKVYENIFGDDVKSYSHLAWYIDVIRDTNPGSVIMFERENKQFQRIFITFAACIKGYRFCRPMVYLDATFLTGTFKGCLMVANGINGGKGFSPLSFALVDSETVDTWEWFLRNLTEVVGDGRPIIFLSDRHEGLLQGVLLVYPDGFHSFCYYHLTKNIPITATDPRYSLVMNHFREATYALSPEKHAKAIQKIRDLKCDWVADYIETIPPEAYANAYFKGCRYGRTSSTLAESINSWVVVDKKMPASALLDQIRRKIMGLMAERREIGANMMTLLTPEYEEKLAALQDEGLAWEVLVASPTVFEVLSERSHMVDLEHESCTCQRWRVYGFSCAHALASIRNIKREAIDFISPYFTSDYFRKTYMHVIQPIPNYNRPAEYHPYNTVIPPTVKKQPGRPPVKRILSKCEKKVKRKVHCINCKETGRNKAGCRNPRKFTPH
ncbi:uncharacterized protein LOC113361242 [Papaver somniferum]|uniref:uncharacterized protein LOC113361242 n=1 Tax=Papaver somniferum TaxID=3469 RepID=UPI000E6FEEFA|nr:uncharacterized protein LOC113361242 [Papaver somniferum]